MTLYTYSDVVSRIKGIIDIEGEGFVYQVDSSPSGLGCYYARNGKPDCIVGHLLVELGVPVKELEDHSSDPSGPHNFSHGPIGSHFDALIQEFGIQFDERAAVYLMTLQNRQDKQYSWGESDKEAKLEVGRISYSQ